MAYTDDELLEALRAFAADHDGRPPTAPEANDCEDLPSTTAFVWHFETWNAAVEAAGLEPRDRRRPDEELLTDLRGFAESDGYPSYKAVAAREDMASPQTYEARFGSWNAALETAGLPVFPSNRNK